MGATQNEWNWHKSSVFGGDEETGLTEGEKSYVEVAGKTGKVVSIVENLG